MILTRTPRADIPHRQVVWDGRTLGTWADELDGCVLLNLAGELVDRRPTASNIELLKRSRVEPTSALVDAAAAGPTPALWLQMSTCAIYGDAGQKPIDERHRQRPVRRRWPASATAWEAAAAPAKADRVVILRTGIVLDRGTPAFDRLTKLTRFGLGGRIGPGDQWTSWIHIDDYLRTLDFLIDDAALDGVVHVTSPNPIRNRDMMATLRGASSPVVATDSETAGARRRTAHANRSRPRADRSPMRSEPPARRRVRVLASHLRDRARRSHSPAGAMRSLSDHFRLHPLCHFLGVTEPL